MKERMILNVKVGSDNGNSEHDIIIGGHLITQPNIFARSKELPMLDELNPSYVAQNIENNLLVTISSSVVRPGIYYIGEYARRSGHRITNIEVGADNSKLDSDVVIVNTLGHIAGQGCKELFKEYPNLDKEIIINADMVSSLPVTQYNKEASVELANKFLERDHKLIVHIGNVEVSVTIHFEYVKILPESVPSVFYLQNLTKKRINQLDDPNQKVVLTKEMEELFQEFSSTYKVKAEANNTSTFNSIYDLNECIDGDYFVNKKILHIGIGEGTVEYPITHDIKFDPNFIKGSNNGVGHAIEAAIDDFKKSVKLRTFSRQDFSAILRDESHKYYNIAISEVEPYLEDEANDIFKIAKKEIERANNDVDIIFVHGGGSILKRPYLYNKLFELGNEIGIKVFYVPSKFAVTIEAKGMYEFVKGDIFKKLKEKYIASKAS